jgi:hypothetical protein
MLFVGDPNLTRDLYRHPTFLGNVAHVLILSVLSTIIFYPSIQQHQHTKYEQRETQSVY